MKGTYHTLSVLLWSFLLSIEDGKFSMAIKLRKIVCFEDPVKYQLVVIVPSNK